MKTPNITVNTKDFWTLIAKKQLTVAFTQKLDDSGLTPAMFDKELTTYGLEALRNGTVLWYRENDAIDWAEAMADIALVFVHYAQVMHTIMKTAEADIKDALLSKLASDVFEHKTVSVIGMDMKISLEGADE